MSDKHETEQLPAAGAQRPAAKRISRRDLLRRTAVSMPMVLTLQSGAALARSSNLISTTSTDFIDDNNRTLCLDTSSVFPVDATGEVFDLGEDPFARVTAINEREYYQERDTESQRVSEAQLCQTGGPVFTKHADFGAGTVRGWSEVRVPQGVLVSATALTSFAGSVQIDDL